MNYVSQCIAVVVTYNRKELLFRNIESLLKQNVLFKEIIIIDNKSTDGTFDYLKENGIIQNKIIFYHQMSENLGGSAGFHDGMKIAIQHGADSILLMDDDGYAANENCLKELLDVIQIIDNKDKYFVNALVTEDGEQLSFTLKGFTNIKELSNSINMGIVLNEAAPFNATLVSAKLVREIGYPNRDFFIKGDENDYKARARRANAFIATVIKADYRHPKLLLAYYSLLHYKIPLGVESAWKEYYRARNYSYMYKQNKNYKSIIIELLCFKYIAIFKIQDKFCHKLKLMKFVMKGIWDGLHNKLGKTVIPCKENT